MTQQWNCDSFITDLMNNSSSVQNTIKTLLENHHSIYSSHPTGLFLEEVVCKALRESNPRENVEWMRGGHQSGADLTFSNLRISVKSMKLTKKVISISMYRTTQYPTIESKYGFFKDQHEDCTMGLIHHEKKVGRTVTHHYSLVVISQFPFVELVPEKWTINKKKNGEGWASMTTNHEGVSYRVTHAMSDQLWVYVPTTSRHVNTIAEFTIVQDLPDYVKE
jgi:hypothetical protein